MPHNSEKENVMKKLKVIWVLCIIAAFIFCKDNALAQDCKQGQDAVSYYLQAVKADDRDFKACLCLGDAYSDAGKPVHALRYFSKGIRIIERDPRVIAKNRHLFENYRKKLTALKKIHLYQDETALGNHLDPNGARKLGVLPKIETHVEFDTNQTTIKDDWQAQLDTLAEVLGKDKMRPYKFIIQGHTDIRGTDGDNYKLSLGRAEAVKRYLKNKGVASASFLSVDGKGESRSLDRKSGESDANWHRRNRRVVFISCNKGDDKENCLRKRKAD